MGLDAYTDYNEHATRAGSLRAYWRKVKGAARLARVALYDLRSGA